MCSTVYRSTFIINSGIISHSVLPMSSIQSCLPKMAETRDIANSINIRWGVRRCLDPSRCLFYTEKKSEKNKRFIEVHDVKNFSQMFRVNDLWSCSHGTFFLRHFFQTKYLNKITLKLNISEKGRKCSKSIWSWRQQIFYHSESKISTFQYAWVWCVW